jgi:hypothetical protein
MSANNDSLRPTAPVSGCATVSRRTFLRYATLSVAAVVLIKWRGVTRRSDRCLECAALVTPHRWQEAGRIGRYCPNCGIEMTRQRWDLPLEIDQAPDWVAARAARASGTYAFNQIPFPNRRFVQDTSKPALGRMEIRW